MVSTSRRALLAGDGVVALGRRGFAEDARGVGWLLALDADGDSRWERRYPRDRFNWHHGVATLDDGYALVGAQDAADGEGRGAWLLKVDDAGLATREHQFDAGTRGFAVLPLADGGLLVGGDGAVGDRKAAWLAKLGGEPAPPASGDGGLPSLPRWAVHFVAGAGAGAVLARAADRL